MKRKDTATNETTTTLGAMPRGALPLLRFPEFAREGEWGFEKGNALFEAISDKNHNSDLPILAITQEFGAIPREMIDYQVVVTDKSVESYKVVQVGDFIISLRSFQGGIEYSQYKGICSPAYIILRKKRASISNHFFRFFFKTDRFIASMNGKLEGIRDGKMVSYAQFSELMLPAPSKSEQQKIADCLSSLDDLIAAHNHKLDALKLHKKGLLQRLFPVEGETVPRIRFSEFSDAGVWSCVELRNLLYSDPDYGINAPSVPFSNCLPRYLRITDISDDGVFKNDLNVSVAAEVKDNDYLKKGEIVLARTGASVGKSYKYNTDDGRLVFAGYLIRIRPNNQLVLSDYLFFFLSTERYWDWVRVTSTRSGQPGINSNEYCSLIVVIPPSLPEQQKIADCLSSLDSLIAAEAKIIDSLKEHKKGLMQALFPDPDRTDE